MVDQYASRSTKRRWTTAAAVLTPAVVAAALIAARALLTGLVPVLVSSCASPEWTRHSVGHAQDPEGILEVGLYRDWTTKVLRAGDLQVCYAETPLVDPDTGQRVSQGSPLQVAVRPPAAAPGEPPVIRLPFARRLPYGLFRGERLIGVLDNRTLDDGVEEEGLHLLSQVNGPFFPSYIFQRLLEFESLGETLALALVTEEWARSGDFLGAFSFEGLQAAYGEAEQVCEERPMAVGSDESVQGSRIEVTDASPPHVSIRSRGPFLEAGENTWVSIRGFGDPAGPGDISASAPFDWQYELSSMNVSAEGVESSLENLWESGSGWYGFWSWRGVCLDRSSQRLMALFDYWYGDRFTDGSTVVMAFNDDPPSVALSSTPGQPQAAVCSDRQQLWDEGEEFLPCTCLPWVSGRGFVPTVRKLVFDIESVGGADSERAGVVQAEVLGELLDRVRRLAPFVAWDPLSSLHADVFESEAFEILAVEYRSERSYWDSFQRVFARRRGDWDWQVIFAAPQTSKQFRTVVIRGFGDDRTLEIEACIGRLRGSIV